MANRRLDDSSRWFSSIDQRAEAVPADGEAHIAMNEQLGVVGAVAGQADVLTMFTTLHQSCRCSDCSISQLAPAEGHLLGGATVLV